MHFTSRLFSLTCRLHYINKYALVCFTTLCGGFWPDNGWALSSLQFFKENFYRCTLFMNLFWDTRLDHSIENYAPYSLPAVCGFFNFSY